MNALEASEIALDISNDLALGTSDAYQRVLLSAADAAANATEDLTTATGKRDTIQGTIDEKTATIEFMTATEIDTSTTQGAKDAEKLENLAVELEALNDKLLAATSTVDQISKVVANANQALLTAQESIANAGKSQEELYAEAQAKQAEAEAAAVLRAEEAERQKNLQAEMEAAARAKKEEEERKRKEAEEKALLEEQRRAAEQAALQNADIGSKIIYYQDLIADETTSAADKYDYENLLETLLVKQLEIEAEAQRLEEEKIAKELEIKAQKAADEAAKLKAEADAEAARVKAEAEAAAAAELKRQAEAAAAEEERLAQKANDENALLEAQAMTDLYLEQLDVAVAENDLETVMWLLGEIGKYAGLLYANQEKAEEAAAYEAEQEAIRLEEEKAARAQAALDEEAERLRLENQDALLIEMQDEKALATAAYNDKYDELYNTYYYIWETDFWFEYEGQDLEDMWAMEDELDVLQDDLNYWAAQVNMILSEKSKREQAALDLEAAALAAQQAYDAEQKAKAAEEKKLAAEAEAEAVRLQQEAEAAEREALRLAQEEEQRKLDRKLRDIDNLPEDERLALLAEVLQQKIDVALNDFSDEFW